MKSNRECPGGHNLERWRNRVTTLRCDGPCGLGLKELSWRWSCGLCDYDICEACSDTMCRTASRSATPAASCRSAQANGTSATAATTTKPAAPASASLRRPPEPKAPAGEEQASPGRMGSEETPVLGTAREGLYSSSVYMAPGLESVKRHLDVAWSGGPSAGTAHKKQRSKTNLSSQPPQPPPAPDPYEGQELLAPKIASAAAQLSLRGTPVDADVDPSVPLNWSRPHIDAKLPPLSVDENGGAPSLLEGLPPLQLLNLPPAAAARMLSRREWLQQLLAEEVDRANRAATTGGVSAFEAACGVKPEEPLPPKRAAALMAATLFKFEEERAELVRCELIEIEALQALAAASS